jgi:alginate O-acetyltransferase complex protein AlgI
MLFNSYIFWCFFLAVMGLYKISNHRWQNRMLLVASYVFYGAWNWRFLSLIVFSTAVNYAAGLGIARANSSKKKRLFLFLSIGTSLGLLGVFKYYGFFAGELKELLTCMGIPFLLPTVRIVLPVGISFYTFQAMSYTIDVYRGDTEVTDRPLDFALYVAFFPQLVAGPIERSSRLLPQVLNPRVQESGDFAIGLYHVLMGLFKKIIIADNMAGIVNVVFARDLSNLSGGEVLIGVYAFAFQIYGDFSGYSSVARGISRWMGFRLMTNFNSPYLAVSPSDFWGRWHISLSSWLRDYLYISLGGNRKGQWKTYRNLMLTMLLGGLWHGAGWTFIAWGAFHGAILCIYRVCGSSRPAKLPPDRPIWKHWIAVLVMFQLACVGWLLFRAESMSQVSSMLYQLVTNMRFTEYSLFMLGMLGFFVVPIFAFEVWLERKHDALALTKIHWLPRAMWYSYLVLMLWFFGPEVNHEFIYFQF